MVPKKKKKSVKHANANVPVRTTQRPASMTRPSAIFMQGDGDRLISPSSCSQVLEMRLSHTPKIVRWTAWKPVITRTEFINGKTGTEKTKFLIQGFSEAATKEVLGWIFFFSLPYSSESSKLRADHCKGHCHICWKSNHWDRLCEYERENRSCLHRAQCLWVKNRVHLASYLHNKHVSFGCLIWYSH